ncbi:MAG: thiamine phosphate synthase [Candidatus Omnitrophica bacterium]|nr:thiamine phosphate synthase [Candidatus Omnitrophota bacterium]MDD5436755.1 thiamine phosphate synthase [Candidatus Omnitrophota bacterium]
MKKIKEHSLYLLLTEEYCCGRNVVEIARHAIAGGVDLIQLREKNNLRSDIADIARSLAALCKKNKVTFIINDDPILAKTVDADGVHLGQGDLKLFTVKEARKILGARKLIGLSMSSVKDIANANNKDIDYIGFGPVFPTAIKEGCVGTKCVAKVLASSKTPVFFIGGINFNNVDKLLAKGAKNIAVIRAISEADDIKAAAKNFKEKLKKAKHGKTA